MNRRSQVAKYMLYQADKSEELCDLAVVVSHSFPQFFLLSIAHDWVSTPGAYFQASVYAFPPCVHRTIPLPLFD